MKKLSIAISVCLLALSAFGKASLTKLHNPTLEQAKEFFNWDINRRNIVGVNPDVEPIEINGMTYYPGRILDGYNEFRSSKGNTLHVGNDSYTPAQPGEAFGKTIEAMDKMNLDFSVNGVGSFDNDANIFAQFEVIQNGKGGASKFGYNGSEFSVNGKQYKGFITMGKGNDESFPLSYWLTIVCIVCANTWRKAGKARKGNAQSITMRQTKNSGVRFETIADEIAALFGEQETVQATLQRMASQAVSLSDAEKAFLGLIKPVSDQDFSKTGKTRLENSLERYKMAFVDSPGVNGGNTREDWFNAVTNVDTHGNTESKNFDSAKQFVSSEFGTYAQRKEKAFAIASNDEAWQGLVQTGSQIMDSLLSRPVIISQTSVSSNQDFARLLGK